MALDTHGANGEPWTGFDLDGTLAVYDKWRGVANIGKPIKPMCDLIRKLHDEGKSVKILTARVAPRKDGSHHLARVFVARWCRANLGFVPPITHEKDALMETLYDDRVHAVEQNTGKVLNMAKFKVGDKVYIRWKDGQTEYGRVVGFKPDGKVIMSPDAFKGVGQIISEERAFHLANAEAARNAEPIPDLVWRIMKLYFKGKLKDAKALYQKNIGMRDLMMAYMKHEGMWAENLDRIFTNAARNAAGYVDADKVMIYRGDAVVFKSDYRAHKDDDEWLDRNGDTVREVRGDEVKIGPSANDWVKAKDLMVWHNSRAVSRNAVVQKALNAVRARNDGMGQFMPAEKYKGFTIYKRSVLGPGGEFSEYYARGPQPKYIRIPSMRGETKDLQRLKAQIDKVAMNAKFKVGDKVVVKGIGKTVIKTVDEIKSVVGPKNKYGVDIGGGKIMVVPEKDVSANACRNAVARNAEITPELRRAYDEWQKAKAKFDKWWNPDRRFSEKPPKDADEAKKSLEFAAVFKKVTGKLTPNGYGSMTLEQMVDAVSKNAMPLNAETSVVRETAVNGSSSPWGFFVGELVVIKKDPSKKKYRIKEIIGGDIVLEGVGPRFDASELDTANYAGPYRSTNAVVAKAMNAAREVTATSRSAGRPAARRRCAKVTRSSTRARSAGCFASTTR